LADTLAAHVCDEPARPVGMGQTAANLAADVTIFIQRDRLLVEGERLLRPRHRA
jgi:hypothetical protein